MSVPDMFWPSAYWDAVEQFYWTPSYLGLKSISKDRWGDDPEVITLPRSALQKGASLYTRSGNARTNAQRLRTLEETLNHLFDITFGIAPDQVLAELFFEPLGIDDGGPIERLGRDIRDRYGWGNANVTQQDMFLVTPRSVVGVELKLGSVTSPVQVLKYLALMVLEERRSGQRESIGLLYVTPKRTAGEAMDACGADREGRLPNDWLNRCDALNLNATLRDLLSRERDALRSAASRLWLTHISWGELVERIERIQQRHTSDNLGDQTLQRLLGGFCHAVRSHVGAIVD